MSLGCCCGTGVRGKVAATKIWQGWRAFNASCPCDTEITRYLRMSIHYTFVTDGVVVGDLDGADTNLVWDVDRNSGMVTLSTCTGPEADQTIVIGVYCNEGDEFTVATQLTAHGRKAVACQVMDPCDLDAFYTGGATVYSQSETQIVLRNQVLGPIAECPALPNIWQQWTFTLSDPYTYDDAVSDTNELLDQLRLQYVGAAGKLVSRDEVSSFGSGWPGIPKILESFNDTTPVLDRIDPCGWSDDRGATGAIETGPVTLAYRYCGAWYRYDGLGVIAAQKWYEQKLTLPAHNWFRPASVDRLIPDLDYAARMSALDNTDPSAPIFTHSDVTWAVNDVLLVFDGAHDRSLWTVTAKTATTTTLGNKRNLDQSFFDFAKAFLPIRTSGGGCSIGVCDGLAALIAPQLFPSAWPILGQIGVSSATQNGSDVDITLATAAPIIVGDSIEFVGVGSLTTHTVSAVTSSTEFTISLATVGAYSGGGYAKGDGAPDASWNSTEATGDYVYKESGNRVFFLERIDDGGAGLDAVEVSGGNTIFRFTTGLTTLDPPVNLPLCAKEGDIVWVGGCPEVEAAVERVEHFPNPGYNAYWEIEVSGEHPDALFMTHTPSVDIQANAATGTALIISPNASDTSNMGDDPQVYGMPIPPVPRYAAWTGYNVRAVYKYIQQYMHDPLWQRGVTMCGQTAFEDGVDTIVDDPTEVCPSHVQTDRFSIWYAADGVGYYEWSNPLVGSVDKHRAYTICTPPDYTCALEDCVTIPDERRYFTVRPAAPLEEARIEPPDGAPELPVSAEFDACHNLDFCQPLNPYVINPARLSCIADAGRFADAYTYNTPQE